jgi:cytochrome P450
MTQLSSSHEPPDADRSLDIGAPELLDWMIELFKRHGDIYRARLPARRSQAYVIHHPDDVRRVLISNHRNYTKGVDRDRIKVLLGLGIMTSDGELWQSQRRMMQPFFHRRMIARFARVISEANDRLIARWQLKASHGAVVNITEEMSELTLEIVLHSIFGRDTDQIAESFAVVMRETARNLDFVYRFRALGKLVAQLIKQRRKHDVEHFDYLSMLMQARDKDTGAAMGDRQLNDEIMTLVVAGHETTASVLNWTWYLLSLHPMVEARLCSELAAHSHDTHPTLAQVESLSFAQQVLNEVMRLYPPGWLLSRRTIEPDVLSGFSIGAGTDVLLPLYLLHRHPRYWIDPDRFDPDRFSAEREAKRPRFTFVPFAAGPRHCIGETLALYEMLMHIDKVVPRFKLTLVPEGKIELDAQINLRARHPLRMKLTQRETS